MKKITRLADSPEIEAKKKFSEVIDYEYKLIKNIVDDEEIEKNYKDKLIKEYIDLFLHKAKIVERRNRK